MQGDVEAGNFFFLGDPQANGGVEDFEEDEGDDAAVEDGDDDRSSRIDPRS